MFYLLKFRNLKKDLLVNSINQKELIVEIEFEVEEKLQSCSCAKPNKFELYTNDFINQDANERLSRTSRKEYFKDVLSPLLAAVLGSANFTFYAVEASRKKKTCR